MSDWTNRLKVALESTFSMPFDVSQHTVDGEEHYTCCPHNEGGNVSLAIFKCSKTWVQKSNSRLIMRL